MSTERLMPPPPPPEPTDNLTRRRAVFAAVVAWLTDNFGLLVDGERGGSGKIVPLRTRTETATALTAFRTKMRRYKINDRSPLDDWLDLPLPVTEVAGFRTEPDKPWPTFIGSDNRRYVNLYLRPTLPEDGDAAPGHEFLEVLLPDPRERAWFKQWLGHKLRHPAIPGPSIVMIAQNRYGVGRSTFYKILAAMFGAEYVARPDFADVIGRDGQAVYTDWMANAVLALVNETSSEGDHRYRNKQNASKRLQEVIDTSRQVRWIKGKYKMLVLIECGPGFIFASNYAMPLAMVDKDRRLTFLTNGDPREPEFYARLNAWREVPGNIGAFRRDLEAVDLAGFDAYAPLHTTLKDIIVEDSRSTIDVAVIAALDALPGEIVQLPQMIMMIEVLRPAQGWDLLAGWKGSAETAAKDGGLCRIGIPNGANWHPCLPQKGGRRLAAYARSREAQKRWTDAAAPEVLAELQKNEAAIERLRKAAGRLPPFTTVAGDQQGGPAGP